MDLDNIGFYTLSETRAKKSSIESPLIRAELILTNKCNLRCLYCRGLLPEFQQDISLSLAQDILRIWTENKLQNIRFSGGEPTLYPHLISLVQGCKNSGVKRIAISTNGTAILNFYKELIKAGVNDFSISLDGGCCVIGDKMSGGMCGAWEKAVNSIRELSKLTYVTVGVVFNEINVSKALETILFIDSLHPSDIRIISSAQYDKAIKDLEKIPQNVLNKYSILKYRIKNSKIGKQMRGLDMKDYQYCPLVLDDVAVVGNYHFPCIIYLREQGKPIGVMTENFRQERQNWFLKHKVLEDSICQKNCLDVCRDYNLTWRKHHKSLKNISKSSLKNFE
jgi:molybdenum cofactor biosynthesis enzyme MoaA